MMKRIIVLVVAVLTLTSFGKSSDLEFDIIGKWKGQDGKDIGYIDFQKDGYVTIEHKGKIIGGKEFTENGKRGSMSYEVDFSKSIKTVDIIIKKLDSGETVKLLGIIEIVNNNQFKMQMVFDGIRPTKFDDNQTIIFDRVE